MFISLEGPEGSGKTCQLPDLADFLRAQGYTVVTTREPGGTQIGDQVRQVLFDLKNKAMGPRTETLLFQASRAQLVDEVIRPALAAGQVVLSDRYADSTIAYQGYGHQQDVELVRNIVHYATGGLQPHLTLLLDLEIESGLARRRNEGDWNRLDDYTLAFHRRVRAGYHQLAQQDPHRWAILDASQSLEAVQADLRRVVLARLKAAR